MSLAQAIALAIYKARRPKSRAITTAKYTTNGANGPRQRSCILCGTDFPSWCGKWRRTKRSIDAELAHDCAPHYIRKIVGAL